ncbi:MAG: hypothetical protein ACAH80_00600 [Alphaproteobacteria bacterium]
MSYRSLDASIAKLVDLRCKQWELSQYRLTGEFAGKAAKSEAEGEKACAAKGQSPAKGNAPKN